MWTLEIPARNKMTAQNPVLHLRSETKPFERRSACKFAAAVRRYRNLTISSDTNDCQISSDEWIYRQRRAKSQADFRWRRIRGCGCDDGAGRFLDQCASRSCHYWPEATSRKRWYNPASCVPHAHLSPANLTLHQPPSIIHTFTLGIATKIRKAGTAIFLALHVGAARSMTSSFLLTGPGNVSPRSGSTLASPAQQLPSSPGLIKSFTQTISSPPFPSILLRVMWSKPSKPQWLPPLRRMAISTHAS